MGSMAGTILIVDDVATSRILWKVKLSAAFYRPILAATGAEALCALRAGGVDLVLLGERLPDMTGLALLAALRADPALADVPVIFLSEQGTPQTRRRAIQSGADAFVVRPVDDQVLLARMRALVRGQGGARDMALAAPHLAEDEARMGRGLERRQKAAAGPGLAEGASPFAAPARIALIAESGAEAEAWRAALAPKLPGHRLHVLCREEALTAALEGIGLPDAFIITADLDERGGGLRLLSELRARPQSRHAVICILCPGGRPDCAAMALDLGASDVLEAPFDGQELALHLRKLLRRKRAEDAARATLQSSLRLALTDPLTGLYNRRYALPALAGMAERAALTGLPFAVMIVDLDRFKTVNDRFGHAAGDCVLVEVAARLSAHLRQGDLLARIGGEEFLIGLPDTDLATAEDIADRLCEAVQAEDIATASGAHLRVTASIGLAEGQGAREGGAEAAEARAGQGAARGPMNLGAGAAYVQSVIERADEALYRAKAQGRNQVTISRSAA